MSLFHLLKKLDLLLKLPITCLIALLSMPVFSNETPPPNFPADVTYVYGTGEHYNNLASCIKARDYLKMFTRRTKLKVNEPISDAEKKLYDKQASKCLTGMFLLTEAIQANLL